MLLFEKIHSFFEFFFYFRDHVFYDFRIRNKVFCRKNGHLRQTFYLFIGEIFFDENSLQFVSKEIKR